MKIELFLQSESHRQGDKKECNNSSQSLASQTHTFHAGFDLFCIPEQVSSGFWLQAGIL